MDYALSNDIYIGSVSTPLYHFTNRSIVGNSAKGVFAVDTIGNELSIDTFNIVIRYAPGGSSALIYAPVGKDGYKCVGNQLYALRQASGKDFMKELPYGTPVWWYNNSSFFAKGYLKSVDRIGKYAFKLTCISGVGLLDTKMHVGGLYTGQTVSSILSSIIGSTVTYSVSNAVGNVLVYGHLPYDTARANLHRLLFSCGAAMVKGNSTTDYSILYLDNTITSVPASRVALGGSVNYQLPTNKVEVTEHGFYQTINDETVVLYDNTNSTAADNLTVIFKDAPAYNLGTTGTLTISESGVNHAVVSGVGTLTGKMYTHTRQIVTLSEVAAGDAERVKRVTDNELISSVNSQNVARRVLAFYKSAKTIKAKIMLNSEKCGSLLRLTDAFGDVTEGFLQKVDVLTTTVKGANCDIVEGYMPGNNGNNFTRERVFSLGNTTWTVPSGVTSIRIVLIGAGQGGQGGFNGEDGLGEADMTTNTHDGGGVSPLAYITKGYANGNQPAAKGGAGGAPGNPGKFIVYDRTVTPGEVLTISPGASGTPGGRNGGIGGLGGATTVSSTNLGTLTSADGVINTNGYYDAIGKTLYASTNKDGLAGGDGGQTDSISLYGALGGNGLAGGDSEGEWTGGAGGYSGGSGGTGKKEYLPYPAYEATLEYFASGGGGGGGAYGVYGSNGGNGTVTVTGQLSANVTTGKGGNGATPPQPSVAFFGFGGHGGHGGGGGGNAGGGKKQFPAAGTFTIGTKGLGGAGGFGGYGGMGAVIIYY